MLSKFNEFARNCFLKSNRVWERGGRRLAVIVARDGGAAPRLQGVVLHRRRAAPGLGELQRGGAHRLGNALPEVPGRE